MTEQPNMVSGLIRKRSELAGLIEHLQSRLRETVTQLDHVEATLRIFAPDIDLGEIAPRKVPTAHHAFRGEVSRIILETLRSTTRPLDTIQLTKAVMRERGLDTEDRVLLGVMSKRVGACLRHWKNKGALTSMKGPGQRMMWEVAG